ncbi:multiple sugar transport system permease protein [Nakamurella panacisegetis]|uniref:Multiple sugar transport system permease protein n=1 Tax=Nakamurella panacisegetis TaxID=1090615 RepID=A0A1H0JFJ9_9ACTN|nr:carbohydrate ABC transporter permease [Nakamurella panacisegetis]SDO42320.1 multiple sugar transport system permease protein [Nakamurella panacisegetis]
MTTTVAPPPATVTPKPKKVRSTGVNKPPNKIGMLIGSIVVVAVFVAPYLIMLFGSLKTQPEITHIPPVYFGHAFVFSNYATMWSSDVDPLSGLIATVVISVFATLLVLVAATPAAYYLARFRFPGRLAFLFLVLITQMLQPTVLAVGLFREFLQLGINDTWFAMILVNGAFNLAFAIWIMQAFFASVPKEVDEAAVLDGASKLQVLFRVSLPLVWPGIVTAIIFVFVSSWNEYAASSVIMTTNSKQPLTVSLPRFFGLYTAEWQYVFGVSIVAIVPVVVLFAFIEKRLIGGLTAGAVK